jgi:hypothetical protein
MTGCFEEGGDTAREEAANVTVESILAFGDIQKNLETDPAAAGEALTKFIRTPIAAGNMLGEPISFTSVEPASRIAMPTEVPLCYQAIGPTGCDGINTTSTCEAGTFTFSGSAARTCGELATEPTPNCLDVLGSCTYSWGLQVPPAITPSPVPLTVGFTLAPNTAFSMTTSGSATIDVDAIGAGVLNADINFDEYSLTTGDRVTSGQIRVCSCGDATVALVAGKRRLVNSSFVAKDLNTGLGQRCALATFDAAGKVTVSTPASPACACADGTTCAN